MHLRTKKATPFDLPVGDAVLSICPMSSTAMNLLRQKHTTMVGGVEKIDGSALTREMFDLTVKGFVSGVLDEDGNALVCTSSTKAAIYENDGGFVTDTLKAMDAAETARRAGMEGNSGPGVSGTSPQAA